MVFVELGIEALLFARVDTHKWHQVALLQREHTSGNSWAVFNTKARRPRAAAPCVDCHHQPAVWHTRGSEACRIQPAKSRWPASRFTTRAKSPQHEDENRAMFFMHRRKASRKALFFQAISELRSLLTVCVPHSALNRSSSKTLHSPSYLICWLPRPLPLHASHVTPINPPLPGSGLLAQNPGLLPACSCFRDLFHTFTAYKTLEYKTLGEVHRGAITNWGNESETLPH